MLSFLKNKQIIITLIICATFLFTGWTAGSALGYRSGFVAAQKQQNNLTLASGKIKTSENIKALLTKIQHIRDDLMISFKGEVTRDFLTVLSAHQKGSAKLCRTYKDIGNDLKVIEFCEEKIMPSVERNRNIIHRYLISKGMK